MRYATLGFNQEANLDDGHMWPTAFALTELGATDEAKIAALVKKAVTLSRLVEESRSWSHRLHGFIVHCQILLHFGRRK